jgi:hypothetical protein
VDFSEFLINDIVAMKNLLVVNDVLGISEVVCEDISDWLLVIVWGESVKS